MLIAFCIRVLVAAFLLRSGGGIPERIDSHSTGVGFRHPVIVLKDVFIQVSINLVWTLFPQTGAQYSAVDITRAIDEIRKVFPLAPHPVPANLLINALRALIFLERFVIM